MDTITVMGQIAWELKWWIAAIVVFLTVVFTLENGPLKEPLQED